MTTTMRAGAAACATMMTLAGPLAGQAPGYPELTRDEEIRLALSAGPPGIAARADVWVLGEAGFERVLEGDNGFACLVVRSAADRRQVAPHCLSPDAVRTALPAYLAEGELQVRGLDADAVEAELRRRWQSGELPLPSGGAYAYMLSAGQRIGPGAGAFQPHLMLYAPYATNADIGGDPRRPEFPFVGPWENHPLSTIVILMDAFVEPGAVEVPGRR